MKLAAESLARKQPVLFVRSRCDIDLDNNKKIDNTVVITQKTADDFVEKMLVSFEKEINESKLENVNLVKTFFISSIFLAERLNGEVPTYSFQEKEFLTEIKTAIATLRGKF
uniref:Uncharacterized protein n=1 Tax=Panagrolaimus superbus TaxID=310955 RepID=A0A914YI81_9BILA